MAFVRIVGSHTGIPTREMLINTNCIKAIMPAKRGKYAIYMIGGEYPYTLTIDEEYAEAILEADQEE